MFPLQLDPTCLWSPSRDAIMNSQMQIFRLYCNRRWGLELKNYQDLLVWSCEHHLNFWETIWDWCGIVHSVRHSRVMANPLATPDSLPPEWFIGAKLNFAENLLAVGAPEDIAIITTGEGRFPWRVTYGELRELVRKAAAAMSEMGITVGDRVVGYLPNCLEAVVAMLACTSLGALWSSTSPDFGVTGVLDRFKQINPRLLISANAVVYNGKVHSMMEKLEIICNGLSSLEQVVLVPFVERDLKLFSTPVKLTIWNDFLGQNSTRALIFEQLPFSHPVYILFSSGTTGLPKCIVHSAGGTLLQHKKEHMLHGDMTRKDVFLQYTTTGWMMWNWLVSSLSVGATIVLYDGSPFRPSPGILWNLVDELGVTIFGTSPKYLTSLKDAEYFPIQRNELAQLRTILSTGAPLTAELFDFVYEKVKKDVLLGSITGGTDICSLFAGHNPVLPVHKGELQSICLGMKVEAWATQNQPVYGQRADLVCTKPFPCQPVFFWGDDERNSKYRSAYFDTYPGVWYHGDFIWINPKTGGVIMLGRSDGTLNPAGVRFGSAELYHILESYEEIEDSLAVGQKISGDEERVVLFLKIKKEFAFSENLVGRIREDIRRRLSPRHVPEVILPTPDIPYTVNGKKVEVAVKQIISGENYKSSGTLANPEVLDYYRNLPQLRSKI